METCTLFIFEGLKTERNIANNLAQFFIADDSTLIRASYGQNIYKLYADLAADDGLDLLGLLCEQLRKRSRKQDDDQAILELEGADAITDIYLFFDYDPHCTNADDSKLTEMLTLFCDSQDQGLLCISYPMVEAVRHHPGEGAIALTCSTKALRDYKGVLKQTDDNGVHLHTDSRFYNWGAYALEHWRELSHTHLARGNDLVNDTPVLPDDQLEPSAIFQAQQHKHLPEQIRVLSAFPLMLHNYYGNRLYEKLALAAD